MVVALAAIYVRFGGLPWLACTAKRQFAAGVFGLLMRGRGA